MSGWCEEKAGRQSVKEKGKEPGKVRGEAESIKEERRKEISAKDR